MTTATSSGLAQLPSVAGSGVGRRAVMLGAAAAAVARPARAIEARYVFNQQAGTIEFTVHHLGLLSSTGRFTRFDAQVLLDSIDEARAAVDVTVDTGSIALAWPGAEDLLRSPSYFDSARYPTAHFKGSTVSPSGAERFAIRGELSLRGVTRPFDMQGQLLAKRFDRLLGANVADFSAIGALSRSAFGMVADQIMTGDTVRIGVRVTLRLTDAVHAG